MRWLLFEPRRVVVAADRRECVVRLLEGMKTRLLADGELLQLLRDFGGFRLEDVLVGSSKRGLRVARRGGIHHFHQLRLALVHGLAQLRAALRLPQFFIHGAKGVDPE